MTARTLWQLREGYLGWALLAVGCLALMAGACVWLTGCKPSMTPADAAVVSQETDEQATCVELYKPDTAKIDACRAQVKAKYDAYWRTHFMPDGGAK